MISPCGIDCSTCPIYIAANDKAEAVLLAQKWRDSGIKEAKAEWYKCQGCNGNKEFLWSNDCKIRECCKEVRKIENCSECNDFPCEKLLAFENDGHAHHKAAIVNLRRMRGAEK